MLGCCSYESSKLEEMGVNLGGAFGGLVRLGVNLSKGGSLPH